MADILTLNADEENIHTVVAVLRQVLERLQPSEDLAAGALLAANNLDDLDDAPTALTNLGAVAKVGDTMAGTLEIDASNSTTSTEYLRLKPTDFGSNKPYIAIKKETTADKWTIILWDGSDTNGIIDINCQTITHQNSTIWDATSLPAFNGSAGYVPASGGGTANFLRADGTFNVPPGTGGITKVGENTPTSGTTSSFTSIPSCKLLFATYNNISHNNGANQQFQFALSTNNGSSYGTPVTMFATALAAGVSGSGIVFIGRMDFNSTHPFSSTFLAQAFGGVEISSSGTVNAIQFSWTAGSFDDAAGNITLYAIA